MNTLLVSIDKYLGYQTLTSCPVYRGVKALINEYRDYDTKNSDGEVPVMLELWGMQSTPSLPSLHALLWPRSGST